MCGQARLDPRGDRAQAADQLHAERAFARVVGRDTFSAALAGPSSQATGTAMEASPISYSSHDIATPSRRISASAGRSASQVVAVACVRCS